MKITSLELKGYTRLALSQINYIKLTPINKIQLILGTNGSGKSSLLKELSPLPATHTEYLKGGYKAITIEHNGSTYQLNSLISSTGNKYHFIKDGVELNTGLTISTYRELVKKEFNITQDVHDLMTGTMRFHSMSVSERRNWFTRISDADYTYAIKYYTRLKDQLREYQGAIKVNQARLVQETDKLLTPVEESKARAEILDLNTLLTALLELKAPMPLSKGQVTTQIKDYEAKLDTLARSLVEYRSKFVNEGFASSEDIDQAIIQTQANIVATDAAINSLCEDIAHKQHTVEKLEELKLESVANIDSTIEDLEEELTDLYGQIHLNVSVLDPVEAQQALATVHSHLVSIVTAMVPNPPDSECRITRDSYMRAMDKRKHIAGELEVADNLLMRAVRKRKEYELLKEHNQTECPNCKHVWARGYNLAEHEAAISQVEAISKNIEAKTKELATVDEEIQEAKEYLELYRAYSSIVTSWVSLKPLWEYLSGSGKIFTAPNSIPAILEQFRADLAIYTKIKATTKALGDAVELQALVSKEKTLDISKLAESIEDGNNKLYKLNTTQQNHKQRLATLNIYRSASLEVASLSAQLEAVLESHTSKVTELESIYRHEALNATIQTIRIELTNREQVISRIDTQKALVAVLEGHIAELAAKVEVLKPAVKELSPTEGLIAKGLTGFIDHFVYQINSFIKKIWLYPLELVPVAPTEGEDIDLDYKFSVKVNDGFTVPDISKGSSAMKEVIDMAFMIVSMQYLGLSDAPIYLDEFSASFDKAHRESAFHVITNLITTASFSQIFMVSHYEQAYGSLRNSDITVLCPNNVALPTDMAFNTAVTIS